MCHAPDRSEGPWSPIGADALIAGAIDGGEDERDTSQVQVQIEPLHTALPHIRSGKTRALAVTSTARLPVLPDTPTLAEAAGLPGYELMLWFGLLAPSGTPPAIVQRLNREIARAITSPDVRERFAQQGAEPSPAQTPEQFSAFIQREIKRWAEVVRVSGAKVD